MKIDKENKKHTAEDLSIRDYAIRSNPEYWRDEEENLEQLINLATKEIAEIERGASKTQLPKTVKDANLIKAIWVLSGSGTYEKPITETPGDLVNLDKPWAQGSDKKRIDHAVDHIRKISMIASGDYQTKNIDSYQISDEESFHLIQKYGPCLVYNGISVQNSDLISAIEAGIVKFPKDKLFIPSGKVKRTLDQITTLKFPEINYSEKDKIGVVSHAPHLARVMRVVNKYKTMPEKAEIVLLPLVFEKDENEKEFCQSEMKGIIGYVGSGLATLKPYPYSLNTMDEKPAKDISFRILPSCKSDMKAIYNLSNQASVRKNSFNENPIKLESHKQWFEKKLKDDNVIMLKAVVGSDLAGQVRLEIDKESALVGISVSEDFRGLGIAFKLIQEIIKVAKEKEVRVLEAFIKPENLASIKLFEKAGFKFDRKSVVSGKKALKYIYRVS